MRNNFSEFSLDQRCGSGSALIWVGWIRIHIQERRKARKNIKIKEISCFEVLDVLF
jgi:hypothetical protein